jgi:hypothetical protein
MCPSPTEQNLVRLARLLYELEVRQLGIGIEGLREPEMPFDQACGIEIRVCSLDALRVMKRVVGRPQDLQELADLAKAHPEQR